MQGDVRFHDFALARYRRRPRGVAWQRRAQETDHFIEPLLPALDAASIAIVNGGKRIEKQVGIEAGLHRVQLAFDQALLRSKRAHACSVQFPHCATTGLEQLVQDDEHERPVRRSDDLDRDAMRRCADPLRKELRLPVPAKQGGDRVANDEVRQQRAQYRCRDDSHGDAPSLPQSMTQQVVGDDRAEQGGGTDGEEHADLDEHAVEHHFLAECSTEQRKRQRRQHREEQDQKYVPPAKPGERATSGRARRGLGRRRQRQDAAHAGCASGTPSGSSTVAITPRGALASNRSAAPLP